MGEIQTQNPRNHVVFNVGLESSARFASLVSMTWECFCASRILLSVLATVDIL